MNAVEFVSVFLKIFGLYWYVQALNQLAGLALFFLFPSDVPFYMQFFWVQAALSTLVFLLVGSILTMRSSRLARHFLATAGSGEVLHFDMNSSLLCVAYSAVGLWLVVGALASIPIMAREFFNAFSQRGTPHPGFWRLHSFEVLIFVANLVIGTFLLIGNSRLATFVSRRYATPPQAPSGNERSGT